MGGWGVGLDLAAVIKETGLLLVVVEKEVEEEGFAVPANRLKPTVTPTRFAGAAVHRLTNGLLVPDGGKVVGRVP